MKFKKQACVIVDAYSTGKYLAPSLSGYQCIHIQSSPNLPSNIASSLKQGDFAKCMVYQGNIEPILNQLKNYNIKFCIPGSESGVELADALSEALGLPTNGTKYSIARRNKYLMTQRVQEAGLQTVKHLQSSDVQEILSWAEKLNREDYPIVLKPIDSASGDNVHFCHNKDEINKAFDKVKNAQNLFGAQNTTVLAQSFNTGTEYIVNTVSWEGKHVIAEIWRVNKKLATAIYDTCEIVFSNEPEYGSLVEYTMGVLDALEIRFGAGTTELKYTPEKGPVLIETAARLMGAAELSFSQEIFGYTQLSLTLEAYLRPQMFLQRFTQKQQAEKERYGLAVLLISDAEGILKNELPIIKAIENLPTCFSFDIIAEKDSKINITTDMLSSPGTIYLLGKSKEELWRDYQAIRILEKEGAYRANVKPVTQEVRTSKASDIKFNHEVNVHQFFRLRESWGLVVTSADIKLSKSKENSFRLIL